MQTQPNLEAQSRVRKNPLPAGTTAAFSLVEVLVAVAVFGVTFFAFYAGIGAGFMSMQLARENLRATQVLQEKMETIRLYTWDQVNSNGFVPAAFTAPFYAAAGTNNLGGLSYQGSVTISNAPIAASYSNDVRLVTVEVHWTSGRNPRSRTMSTYVSRYGLQNYIY